MFGKMSGIGLINVDRSFFNQRVDLNSVYLRKDVFSGVELKRVVMS